ncbi:AmmeMemoRadiSam system protein B [Pararhodospirillum oryzae]|uniref:MEMO1 family protein n=1 Tax=Pararhodospirillum oryzae TaxID=478448 RepID=A0A512H468_9PROT|nr:AmmeMemoRadiSam system protein B [Pararhodospirillum oryzae]GEO80223.1 MEMO1 family protein [Pararhodospirillum oryzae]
MTPLRPTAVAGIFYPDQPTQLAATVEALLDAAPRPEPGAPCPKALIVPHAGYVYSGAIAAAGHACLRPFAGRISRVVLAGPSHRVPFRGIALTEAEAYASPLGPVPLDHAWSQRLAGLRWCGRLEDAHAPEHALEVHLPFLARVLGDITLVPLVCGAVSARQMADALSALWGGPETLIVISTDLSHYLPYDDGRAIDATTAQAVERRDPTAIGPREACGHVPLNGLLTLAQDFDLSVQRLDLRSSGDTAGARDRVVGYGAWRVDEPVRGPVS